MTQCRTLTVAQLEPGLVLAAPVFDKHRVKLVNTGTRADSQLIQFLESRGIDRVLVESAGPDTEYVAENPAEDGAAQRIEASTQGRNAVNRCSGCGTDINLLVPTPDFKVRPWVCGTCGAMYFGSDDECEERAGVYRVDPAERNPFAGSVPSSIPIFNVRRLVTSLASEQFAGAEQRAHKRYLVTVAVTALPLAEDFRVDGEAVQMTTANVSIGGAALIHTRFVKAPNLALDFTPAGLKGLQVVLRVLRVQGMGPVYQISGEFISRVSPAFPTAEWSAS